MGTVTDTYVCQDTIYRLLENGNADATLAHPTLTTMFSLTEIIDSLNRVQQKFLLDTGMILTRTTIPGSVGTPAYDLPVDNILAQRLTWTDADNVTRPLSKVDTWELDTGMSDWPFDSGTPFTWWDTTLPQQRVAIAPAPNDTGTIGLLYMALAATVTGAGVVLAVPNDWTPYVLYGTLSELLGSDGESFDPIRAQYCDTRYAEGVQLARIVLGGR